MVAALVDTGSDYDAIDKDLSEVQSERNNVAFRGRTRSRRVNVNGCATVMSHTTDSVADWVLTISGSRLCVGEQVTLEYTVSLAEFALTWVIRSSLECLSSTYTVELTSLGLMCILLIYMSTGCEINVRLVTPFRPFHSLMPLVRTRDP